ncbi:MAG TPA: tetratricopeptide repeat protein, partial [Candidatus Acidoferrum sp.]|nr:tetratricopeptide repeat protein [Candidatus Acidoferrum sp.]
WILVPTGATVWFHVIGVSLLPATLYLLAFTGGKGRRIVALRPSTWGLVLGAGLVGFLILFIYLYTHDLFFKLAFVPLVAYRFTAAGYTLFSLRHLLDIFNLLILLQPGVIVLVMTVFAANYRAALKQANVRFHLIVVACTVFAISILDPKLGMPRDWDLLSIPGVPLAAAAALLLVTIKQRREVVLMAGILAGTLGLLSLAARVSTQVSSEAALAQVRSYYSLDPSRSAPIRLVLVNNLLDAGDTATARVEQAAMLRDYPQQSITDTGIALAERGDYPRAGAYFERAIRIDPLYHKAWTNLGSALAQMGLPDSALAALDISNGLNPYNPSAYYAMGFAWFTKGDYGKGERYLKLARAVDTTSLGPLIGLAMLYQASGQTGKYAVYVDTILNRPTTPYQYLRLIGDNCLQKGDVDRAARAYAAGLKNGLDTSYVRRMAGQFPELARILPK